MKILIVDDSRSIHSLVQEMLDGQNITFQHVYNGQAAVELAASEGFSADLVLLDWEMPELTGIEALPELRRLHPKLYLLMMTSKNSMANIVEALQKGANDYIMKPFTQDILLNKIHQLQSQEVV